MHELFNIFFKIIISIYLCKIYALKMWQKNCHNIFFYVKKTRFWSTVLDIIFKYNNIDVTDNNVLKIFKDIITKISINRFYI